ncbi:MAG: hypothetical protein IKB64_02070 [Paludibacteraceae bacterium]|nr:hypothetical protein [Paludibacteraceae bacterium]
MKLRTKFQDKDFELGEVTDADIVTQPNCHIEVYARIKRGIKVIRTYDSLAEFNSKWEDAPEEPKEQHWAIDQFGDPINVSGLSRFQLEKLHRLGNDFPSENATMKAIKKLKAWQNIKEDLYEINWQPEEGDKFSIWGSFIPSSLLRDGVVLDDHREDLDLLIGRGEE